MAAGKFVRAAGELLRILGEEQSAVVGGIAVNAYGFLRATRDVDIMVAMSLDEARRRVERAGIQVRHLKGDPIEGGIPCLKGVIGVELAKGRVAGVPFDILPQLVPLVLERTVQLSVRDASLRVVDLETLIRLKLKAGSIHDLYDVAILVTLRPESQPRAKELAAHQPDLLARLTALIEDPRTRAKAREVRRQDRMLRDFVRRRTAPR